MKKNFVKIREAEKTDLKELQSLYQSTIDAACGNDYTAEQREVWKSGILDKKRWTDAIQNQYFFIAEIKSTTVGFGSLKNGKYIDFLYVSKNHLRKGIANLIYMQLEKVALNEQKLELISDVSITAKPFFESKGFIIQQKNRVVKDGVELLNFRMTKDLT